MVVLETLEVSPREVRFTQDSISEAFGERQQSPIDRETIEDTFRKLLYGDVTVNSIRTISVVRKDGLMWIASGNRRLYVYKKLEEFGRISKIPVNVVALNRERFDQMYTTKNEGRSIYIRSDHRRARGDKMDDRLRNIYRKWIAHGQPTDGYPPNVPYHGHFEDPFFSGGSTRSTPVWPPAAAHTTHSSPRVSYAEPARPVTQPRPQPRPISAPQPRPPAPKDDSWCAIL